LKSLAGGLSTPVTQSVGVACMKCLNGGNFPLLQMSNMLPQRSATELKSANKKRSPIGERWCYSVEELTVDYRGRLNSS